jgi:hypothetical protein
MLASLQSAESSSGEIRQGGRENIEKGLFANKVRKHNISNNNIIWGRVGGPDTKCK